LGSNPKLGAIMHPQQDHPLGEMLMLPVLLIIAMAAWTVSFLARGPVKH
jgi:hypothetical protein